MNIKTYNLIPYIPSTWRHLELNTEWFREEVNALMRNKFEIIENKGADPTLFYNHEQQTGKNRIGYPLIIYHCIDNCFYITGIEEGAKAISLLAGTLSKPFKAGEVMFDGFGKPFYSSEWEPRTVPNLILYALIKWIPLHYRHYPAFREMTLVEKATEMNQKLFKHISEEMGRFLGISFENLMVEITDITRVYPAPLLYKGHEYHAFDIEFITNAVLPPYLTLGNNKSMGYGRIIPL